MQQAQTDAHKDRKEAAKGALGMKLWAKRWYRGLTGTKEQENPGWLLWLHASQCT